MHKSYFKNHSDVLAAFSTRRGGESPAPYTSLNLGLNTGDDKTIVAKNRERFFGALGLSPSEAAYADQRHTNVVRVAESSGIYAECDALITKRQGLPLAIQVADCACVFLYDKENKAIGLVHSGWRGTAKNIVKETLILMQSEFGTAGEHVEALISPCISQVHFEVGSDVLVLFNETYFQQRSATKWLLDLRRVILDQLHAEGVLHVQNDEACTFAEENVCFSYRRDRENSGRMMGVFMLR